MGEDKGEASQSTPENLTPLLVPLQALQQLISVFGGQGVIIGGIAASLLGVPRYTVDLDAVILADMDGVPRLISEAATLGIKPRISDPIAFARRNRVLLFRHQPTGVDIDISLGELPFEIEMIERSRCLQVGLIQLQLPTPEDLIIMKTVAHRPKDLEDIQAIARNNPDLDKARIENWVRQFSEVLDLPDLWKTISHLF